MAPRERRAREAPVESLALLDPSDPLEREVLLVTVVSQDKMVLPVPREPLVSADLPVWAELREPTETPVALASLACLVPEVLLAALVMLDLKEKLDPQVLLVKMVALAHPALRVREDSLASWASLDQRELGASPAKVERKVFWEPLV